MLDRLLRARRPLILAGGGVLMSEGAPELLTAFAERVEIPVITAWRRYDAFPMDHRLALGSASFGQPQVVWDRIASADVILALGTRFNEVTTQGYSLPRRETLLMHVDIDPSSIGAAAPAFVATVADAGAALRAMLTALPEVIAGVSERIESNARDRAAYVSETTLPAATGSPAHGVSHAHVVRTVQALLPPEAIVVSDAGNFSGWFSRYFRFSRPGTFIGPTSGAMGYGLPAAIGAKLAGGSRPVMSISGDGGFMMSIQELETAARYGVAVVALVLDNRRHGTIRMHQERHHPGRVVGTDLGNVDFAELAKSLGVEAWSVDSDDQLYAALQQALGSNSPALVHVRLDRDELSVAERLADDVS
jgi:acetolactate synthase-1/2/3 large subunit